MYSLAFLKQIDFKGASGMIKFLAERTRE